MKSLHNGTAVASGFVLHHLVLDGHSVRFHLLRCVTMYSPRFTDRAWQTVVSKHMFSVRTIFCTFECQVMLYLLFREPKTALAQETISGDTQVLLDNATKSQLADMLEGNSTSDEPV